MSDVPTLTAKNDGADDSVRPVAFPTAAEIAADRKARTYVVPQRFGMSAMVGIMTALAVLFGILQRLDANPLTYLFFGVMGLAICVVQMFFGGVPRKASVTAGIVIYAVFVCIGLSLARRLPIEVVYWSVGSILPVGALLGYLTGTCAAGIFLVMDYLEQYLRNRRDAQTASHTATGGAS